MKTYWGAKSSTQPKIGTLEVLMKILIGGNVFTRLYFVRVCSDKLSVLLIGGRNFNVDYQIVPGLSILGRMTRRRPSPANMVNDSLTYNFKLHNEVGSR